MAMFHEIQDEGLFGINVLVKEAEGHGTMEYPIFAGMAYVSVRFAGGLTPKLEGFHYLHSFSIVKVRNGVWSASSLGFERMRIYALTATGDFVDDSYEWHWDVLSKPLDGWIRIARVHSDSDLAVLDAHVGRIVTGVELQIDEPGAVQYNFQTVGK